MLYTILFFFSSFLLLIPAVWSATSNYLKAGRVGEAARSFHDNLVVSSDSVEDNKCHSCVLLCAQYIRDVVAKKYPVLLELFLIVKCPNQHRSNFRFAFFL